MEPALENQELPLRWLLSQRTLGLVSIIQQPVSFKVVQATELRDPTPFLSEQALILCVGLAFEEKPEAFRPYVEALQAAGVVAIGFGTGLIFDEVPRVLVEACQEFGLGLFEVPHATAFISITQAVNREFAQRESMLQQLVTTRQRNATQAAIAGGVDALVELAARDLHAAVAIVDNDDRVIARTDYEGLDVSHAPAGSQHHIHHRMLSFGERFHSLVTLSDHSLSAHDRQYIKHVAGLADLLLQRPLSLRRARASLNSLAMSVLLGLDAQPQHLIRAFSRIADSKGYVRPVVIHTNVDRHMSRLLSVIDSALSKADRELCALVLDPKTTLLFFRGTRSPEGVLKLLGPQRSFARVAIGTPQAWDSVDTRRVHSLVTTAKSLPLGQFLTPEDSPLQWINNPEVRTALDHRAQETFSRLGEEDKRSNHGLEQTLITFLHAGGNAKATADILGIHRHTVRTRIARIEDICEVDLSDPVTRAELLIVAVSRDAN